MAAQVNGDIRRSMITVIFQSPRLKMFRDHEPAGEGTS
jgi:hypothetical protein